MKIKLYKIKDKEGFLYRAEVMELPGSPPVGMAKTKHEAIAELFYNLIFDYPNPGWIKMIKPNYELIEEGIDE